MAIFTHNLFIDTLPVDAQGAAELKIKSIAEKNGFACTVRQVEIEGKRALACDVDDPLHCLEIKMHFIGDRFAPNEHIYNIGSEQVLNEAWTKAANVFLLPKKGQFRVDQNPIRITFNWLSDFVDFIKAAKEFGKETISSAAPRIAIQSDLTNYNVPAGGELTHFATAGLTPN